MKYCFNCGKKAPQKARVCKHCGAKVEDIDKVGNTRVQKGIDGKYRWAYEVNLYTNYAVLVDVIKVMFISFGIVFAFIFLLALFEGDITLDWLKSMGKGILIGAGGLLVLCYLGYMLWSVVNGGKYLAMFTMDESGVNHSQHPRHTKRAQKLGMITALVGLLARNPTTAGAGLLSASRTDMSSDFSCVRRVKAVRRQNLIKVNERFGKNRVFVADSDFDFVYDFIRNRCPLAK